MQKIKIIADIYWALTWYRVDFFSRKSKCSDR